MSDCPCGAEKPYSDCCEPVIRGTVAAENPERLMRARYTAHAKQEIDFILDTVEPSQQKLNDRESVEVWAERSEWQGLEILGTSGGEAGDTNGFVEFIARYSEDGVDRAHHELAAFAKVDGRWYFDTKNTTTPGMEPLKSNKVGRNDPCPCGSGKKFKKCCAGK